MTASPDGHFLPGAGGVAAGRAGGLPVALGEGLALPEPRVLRLGRRGRNICASRGHRGALAGHHGPRAQPTAPHGVKAPSTLVEATCSAFSDLCTFSNCFQAPAAAPVFLVPRPPPPAGAVGASRPDFRPERALTAQPLSHLPCQILTPWVVRPGLDVRVAFCWLPASAPREPPRGATAQGVPVAAAGPALVPVVTELSGGPVFKGSMWSGLLMSRALVTSQMTKSGSRQRRGTHQWPRLPRGHPQRITERAP